MHLAKGNMQFTYNLTENAATSFAQADAIMTCLHQNFIEIFILQYKRNLHRAIKEICNFLKEICYNSTENAATSFPQAEV